MHRILISTNLSMIVLFYMSNLNLLYQCKAEDSIKEIEIDFEIPSEAEFITIKDHDSFVICEIWLSDSNLNAPGKFDATDLKYKFNGNLCTHLVLSNLLLTDSFDIKENRNADEVIKFRSIKERYPHLKILLKVQMGTEKKRTFMKNLVDSWENRQKFITNMKTAVQDSKMDGLFIDDEMYFWGDEKFTALARELRDEFKSEDLIIAVEIYLGERQYLANYKNIAEITRIFDLVIGVVKGMTNRKLASYDAPLYSTPINTENVYDNVKQLFSKWQMNSRNLVIKYLITTRVMVIFLRNNTITTDFPFGYGSERVSKNIASPWRQYGRWGYDEICSTVLPEVSDWKMYWDDRAKVPFLNKDGRWIALENSRSMIEKAELGNNLGFGGIGMHALTYDDVFGRCSNSTYPLLKSLNYGLMKSKSLRGSQHCSLFGSHGNGTQVDYQPVLTLSSYQLNVRKGDSAEINCTAEGNTTFKQEWIQVGKNETTVIANGSNVEIFTSTLESFCSIQILTSTLKIKRVQTNASYICQLSYANGTSIKEIDFHVLLIKNTSKSRTLESFTVNQESSTTNPESRWTMIILLNIFIVIGICVGIYGFIKKYQEINYIIDLLNGKKNSTTQSAGSPDKATVDPLYLRFDEKYEIAKNAFSIDRSKLLGTGEFGEVYKGLLDGVDSDVAFKTVRANSGTAPLKALVSELKIMMYIGFHENLVTLLGAYRQEIKNGILYVAIELCELGCLLSFLRKNKSRFLECPPLNPKEVYQNSQSPILVRRQSLYSMQSLLKWSLHISKGMEYLEQKKVIHSDLATRNVLLTAKGDAKVTDFGLSRRTYNYTEYVKKAKDPLPWRWLALESLKTNTFSSQSDVWSFGITLWEMFSLGDIPYPGLAPNAQFVQDLENGMRNFKPKYASNDMYDLMLRCWLENPDERPTFTSLKTVLGNAVSNGTINIYITPETNYENALQLSMTNDHYMELSE